MKYMKSWMMPLVVIVLVLVGLASPSSAEPNKGGEKATISLDDLVKRAKEPNSSAKRKTKKSTTLTCERIHARAVRRGKAANVAYSDTLAKAIKSGETLDLAKAKAQKVYNTTAQKLWKKAAKAYDSLGNGKCAPKNTQSEGNKNASDQSKSTNENEVHFYAYDTQNVNFGPAAPEHSADAAYEEMQARLQRDPALVVATAEALQLIPKSDVNGRFQLTHELMKNRGRWNQLVDQIHRKVDEAKQQGQFGLETVSGPYQTMYMTDEPSGTPKIFDDNVDKPTFMTLKVDKVRFKLNCGFQPVWMPQAQPKPQPAQPAVPVVDYPLNSAPPASEQPETTEPPTTEPPTTEPPTTEPPTTTEPKNPARDVQVNPSVPEQGRGEGTTGVGEDPGPAEPAPPAGDSDGYTDGAEPTPNEPAPEPSTPVEDGANGESPGGSNDGA